MTVGYNIKGIKYNKFPVLAPANKNVEKTFPKINIKLNSLAVRK